MWRNPFLNSCFLMLLMCVLTLQYSVNVFDAARHGGAAAEIGLSHSTPVPFDAEFTSRLRGAAIFPRAAAFFDNLWERAEVVEEWWMDYTAWQWERLDASGPAETNLLEARFHVVTAEVLTQPTSKSARAIKELGRAETSLEAARRLAGSKLEPQLSSISDEIAAVELREQTEVALSSAPFETIKADLDHLITILRSSQT